MLILKILFNDLFEKINPKEVRAENSFTFFSFLKLFWELLLHKITDFLQLTFLSVHSSSCTA